MAIEDKWKDGVSRRAVLKAAGTAAVVGAASGFPAPFVHAAEPVTLRIAGTGVNQFKQLADKAKEDLGFTIQYTSLTSDDVVKRAVTQPTSFDLLDAEYWMMKKIVPSGVMRGMDTAKIKEYDNIVPIFTKGELPNGQTMPREGIAPIKVSYLEAEKSKAFATDPTQWMTLIPTVYNADTLGIRPDEIAKAKGADYKVSSWSDLLDSGFKGKSSILNIPSIGIMDAAMVCEASGLVKYGDKGNMTRDEIDATMKVLTEAKKDGQFRAFWKEFNESVNLMASGEVIIQSMWSPAVTKVRQMGVPCVY
ncbi:MAG: twin-arginine translocation signal domain-containing protein, partial [Alphaproteobacteria bacterium]|nr:twin-arginine translocation signal domain-containing protein [Alphaproteobacteria bacterium]